MFFSFPLSENEAGGRRGWILDKKPIQLLVEQTRRPQNVTENSNLRHSLQRNIQ
jgi:hypothetical protein